MSEHVENSGNAFSPNAEKCDPSMAQNKDLETVALLPVKKVRLTGAKSEKTAFRDLW